MQSIQNPYSNPANDPALAAFHEMARAVITREAAGKDYLFWQDCDHRSSDLIGFALSRPVLQFLRDLGYTRVYLEIFDRTETVMLQAVEKGILSVGQYIMACVGMTEVDEEVGDRRYQEKLRYIGEAAAFGAQIGIRIRGISAGEGIIARDLQKPYYDFKMKQQRAWLDYLQKNPEFFTAPDKLLAHMVLDKTKTWQAGLGKLAAFRAMPNLARVFAEMARTPETATNLRGVIKSVWKDAYGFKMAGRDVTWRTAEKNFNELTDEEKDKLTSERIDQDPNVMARVDESRRGEPSAIFYGAGHMRHERGFLSGLSPDRYAAIGLAALRDWDGIAAYLGADDAMLIPERRTICRVSQLMSLCKAEA